MDEYAPPIPIISVPPKYPTLQEAVYHSTRWIAAHRNSRPTILIEYEGAALAAWVILRSWSHDKNLFANPRFGRHFAAQRIIFWEFIMGKKLETAKAWDKVEWKGFLERPLTDVELEECDGWHAQPHEIWELIEGITTDGYQFQLSYSQVTNMGTATMTDRNNKRATAGYALSAKDENCAAACKALLYKHFSVLKADWSELVGKPVRGKRG